VPIDIAAAAPDGLIAGGCKWLTGPFGAAVCYVSPRLVERLNPPFVGWRSTPDPYHFDARHLTLAPTARKLEFSTISYGAGLALGNAIEYVLELGVERILGIPSYGVDGQWIVVPQDHAHIGRTSAYPFRRCSMMLASSTT
jgi:cysteine desulfurase / selenocysteine lyase